MRQIKIILISLYVIILGFIVFCNTSVFGADATIEQHQVYYESAFTDIYFQEVQDAFDYRAIQYKNLGGFSQFFTDLNDFSRVSYYYVEPRDDAGGSGGNIQFTRGYNIYWYSISNSYLVSNTDFVDATLNNIMPNTFQSGESLTTQAVHTKAFRCLSIYNNGQYYSYENSQIDVYIPVSVFGYSHPIMFDNLNSSTSSGQIANAINNQTNTIVNETQKQTNKITGAVTNSTREQTNALLDTNDTGNDTMSVNDTTTDTSADLGGLFNQINSSFTDTTSETQKGFDLTLPNGDTHTFTLKANVLTSFLDNNPVLKAFYQAFFYVVFGGYVIFDFKKIINKLKEGNIDNVVGSSSPVDSVVNMSLK